MNPQKVIMTSRDLAKGKEAAGEIPTRLTREIWELDLANFDDTVKFARRANEQLDRLDIVILSAAMLIKVAPSINV